MTHGELVTTIADILKQYDSERPVHKRFQPGIGPFGEPQLVKQIAGRLSGLGINARTRRTFDMDVQQTWAIEFKVVRPFGDNGKEAENWSQNLLHPYKGNVSLIGDALKLLDLNNYRHKCLFAICFEHNPPEIDLEPLLQSFEIIAGNVMSIPLSQRTEVRRIELVHPIHQVVRCISWEVLEPKSWE